MSYDPPRIVVNNESSKQKGLGCLVSGLFKKPSHSLTVVDDNPIQESEITSYKDQLKLYASRAGSVFIAASIIGYFALLGSMFIKETLPNTKPTSPQLVESINYNNPNYNVKSIDQILNKK